MTEKDLELKFTEFLLNEKGYPKNSLLKQIPILSIRGARIQPDLLLLDTAIGEYLGLIEFKANINPSIKNSVKNQLTEYLKTLKTDSLPTYLIVPLNEQEFQILVLGEENEWNPILKDEFPEFDSLSARKKIEEKANARELEEKLIEQNENKKAKSAKQSLWTLSSLILGILAAIISVYMTQKSSQIDGSISKMVLENEINKIEKELMTIKSKSIISSHVDTIIVRDSSDTFSGLKSRLTKIENGLINNPDKILTLNRVEQEINQLKEQIKHETELSIMRHEILKSKIDWINALVIGMILALFGAGIGFVITNYSNKKNTTANNV